MRFEQRKLIIFLVPFNALRDVASRLQVTFFALSLMRESLRNKRPLLIPRDN